MLHVPKLHLMYSYGLKGAFLSRREGEGALYTNDTTESFRLTKAQHTV